MKNKQFKRGIINGCFDLLHEGHINLIKTAQESCDMLIVCINSDLSIIERKGKSPIDTLMMRISKIEKHLRPQDVCKGFTNEADLEHIILREKPDVMFKSREYFIFTGMTHIPSVVWVDRIPNISTSTQKEKSMKSLNDIADRKMPGKAPKVTKEQIEARIKQVRYLKIGDKMTHCTIELDNGFETYGESACVNAENYDERLGREYSYKRAFDKMWAHMGFLLAERQFRLAGLPTNGMSYAAAIGALKLGEKVGRIGWRAKDMWISLSPGTMQLPAEKFWSPHNRAFAESNGGAVDVLPAITFKTCNGQIMMGWTPTQIDQLAEDWEVLS